MTINCVNCGAPPRRRAASCEYCGTLAGGDVVMSDEYGDTVVHSARLAAMSIGALSRKTPEPAEPVSYGPLSWTAITAGAVDASLYFRR